MKLKLLEQIDLTEIGKKYSRNIVKETGKH